MLISVYMRQGTLRTDDKGDKLFYNEWGREWEKVSTIKDSGNYDAVIERLKKQYNCTIVIEGCVVKKKWGWKYFTDEEKLRMVNAVKAANTGKVMSDETKAKMADSKRGRPSNALGSRKSAMSKTLVSIARMGKSTVAGRRWCHCPKTGNEKRLAELPNGWDWGRTPEIKDWLKRY
jgi:hypothetical protein